MFADADLTLRWPLNSSRSRVFSLTYDSQYLHSFTFYSSRFGANKGEYVVPAQLSHNLNATLTLANGRYAVSLEARNFTDENLYDNFSLQKSRTRLLRQSAFQLRAINPALFPYNTN